MSLHRVVMFEEGWGVFYYIRFLLEIDTTPNRRRDEKVAAKNDKGTIGMTF